MSNVYPTEGTLAQEAGSLGNQSAGASQPQTYRPFDETIVAEICHEANRALCEVTGDFSQKPWRFAENWQRDSAINGVKFALANPDAPDSAQHDAWMAEKIAAGWTYGPEKDGENKVHNCLVPFEQLPPHQQAKDALFRGIVQALAPYLQV